MTPTEELQKLATARMPFGKYKDKLLIDLPEYYLLWYARKGYPPGILGNQMRLVQELKLNGLEYLVRKIGK